MKFRTWSVSSGISRPPVIVMGMHRSGTSMLIRLLAGMGLLIGKQKGKNDEAFFFQHLNNWMLDQSGGRWDHPKPFLDLLADKASVEVVLDYLSYILETPRIIKYTGLKRYLRYRSLTKLNFPWGWKDPRTTFTLPIWMDIFPSAKIIYITRNGIDVAHSLMIRQAETLWRGQEAYFKKKSCFAFYGYPDHFSHSPRCASIEGGFSLWEEYLAMAQTHLVNFADQILTVRFEDFVQKPAEHLLDIAAFCRLRISRKEATLLTANINSKRSSAYRKEPSLMAFENQVRNRLAAFGY
jgi:hypothetical protein